MLRRRTALSTTLAQGSTMLSQGPTCGLRPALGTGHRLGIQNAPAGGPSQITDHITSKAREGGTFRETETRNAICLAFLNACDSAVAPLDDLAQLAELDLNAQRRDR